MHLSGCDVVSRTLRMKRVQLCVQVEPSVKMDSASVLTDTGDRTVTDPCVPRTVEQQKEEEFVI